MHSPIDATRVEDGTVFGVHLAAALASGKASGMATKGDRMEKAKHTRPVELFYVQVPDDEAYSAEQEYRVVRATDVAPDEGLAQGRLNIALLNFQAGDLPDEFASKLHEALANGGPLRRRLAALWRNVDEKNEVYLKIGVDYYSEVTTQDATGVAYAGPYAVEYGIHFVVRDWYRAGQFADRQIFENVRIGQRLVLRVELTEIDEVEKSLVDHLAVLDGTGLDSALNLTVANPAITIASRLFDNIARLNGNDPVWDESLSVGTHRAPGQSMLRAGIYALVEVEQRDADGDGRADVIPLDGLHYRDGVLFTKDASGGARALVQRNYVVLGISASREHQPRRLPIDAVAEKAVADAPDFEAHRTKQDMRQMVQQFPVSRY